MKPCLVAATKAHCLKFFFTCFAESGLWHMKYTSILTVVQVYSLKSKTIWGFFLLWCTIKFMHILCQSISI